jgi:hypothetical protein
MMNWKGLGRKLYCPGWALRKTENSQSGQPVSWLRFKLSTSQIWVWGITSMPTHPVLLFYVMFICLFHPCLLILVSLPALFSLLKFSWCFRGVCCLHLQEGRISQVRDQYSCHCSFIGLFFDPDNGLTGVIYLKIELIIYVYLINCVNSY